MCIRDRFARVGGQTACYRSLVPLALLAGSVLGLHRRVEAGGAAAARVA